VRWWNAATASATGSVATGLGEVIALELSPDGRLLAVANLDTTISLWSVADRSLQNRLTDLVVAPYALDFSNDGRLLAAGGADRIVRCWDAKTWQVSKTLAGQPDPVWAVAFAAANRLMITAGQNAFDPSLPTHLRVWDVAGSQLLQDVLLPAGVSAMTSTPDGRTLVFAGVDPSIRIWDVIPPP
jgi:WD40 repeat protein